jgi:carbonic anhydrase
LGALGTLGAAAAADAARSNPDQVWKELQAGNRRYVAGRLNHPHQAVSRRTEVARGQHPGATILTCSDSRVPPELIFDVGLGDVFVVRIAGNIANDHVLGSVEYAAEHLGASLLVVLGHERCGAVAATLQGSAPHGHVGSLLQAIQPAVNDVKGKPGDSLDLAIRANVRRVAEELRSSQPVLAELVSKGKVKVVGAIYDLDTGLVSLVP